MVNRVVYTKPNSALTIRRVLYTTPYDSEVEYLQSSGTQYFDTGVTINSDYTVSIKASVTANNYIDSLWCARSNYEVNTFTLFKMNSTAGTLRFDYNTSKNTISNTDVSLHTYKAVGNKLYIDDTLIYTATAATFTAGSTVTIFASRVTPTDSPSYFTKGKLYAFSILDNNGVTLIDLIPVRVGQIGYMYDKVSGKLFGNKGIGNFILGQDVANPVPNIRKVFKFGNKRFVMPMLYDKRIEYLESTGTQYIDTAIYGSNNSKVEVDLQLLELGESKAVFGCYTSKNNSLYMYQAGGNSYGKWQFGFGWNANIGTTDTNRHLVVCENFDLTIDGSLIFSHVPRTFTTLHTMLLFNMHNNSGGIYSATGIRIFSCKLYNGNTLVRDFIPVRRGNVGYMYDKVSGKLFGNSGTGQFILGNDIND